MKVDGGGKLEEHLPFSPLDEKCSGAAKINTVIGHVCTCKCV